MRKYFEVDPWKIIEENFDPAYNRVAESVMSLGNGQMGIRGNFAEKYTGDSLAGTYLAGVYYPDKTVVGWWKIGYPEYFAKVPNATNFIGIDLSIDEERIDLAKVDFSDFSRELNMKEGYLERNFTVNLATDKHVQITEKRFLSKSENEIAVIRYSVKSLDQNIMLTLTPYLDGNVRNEDANYNDYFWNPLTQEIKEEAGFLTMETRKTNFRVATAMNWQLNKANYEVHRLEEDNWVGNKITVKATANEELILDKYIAVTTSRDYKKEIVTKKAVSKVSAAAKKGYQQLFREHTNAWQKIWQDSDIIIEGDPAAQQAIRFNIFQLNQTYTGEDPRLNIGPKGFTGEKYGGLTYWDTEAYCLPFYLATHNNQVSKNLLLYRYRHLEKAKENAGKLGLAGALYPMVTINGEECHNEWEITFEEIHRNGAIAYAIFDYVRYTDDKSYLADYGLPVLTEISRFWADRVQYNKQKNNYMILGVTGPNEYENNINNNWYTNKIAVWTLNYTLQAYQYAKINHPDKYEMWQQKLNLSETELKKWQDISKKMYYPRLEEYDIYAQQDGYQDKEQITKKDIAESELPLNQNWSWDKILRSPFIKQADVLQGIYFFLDEFTRESIKKHFDYYEPRTVHESSLSPCVYAIIAAEIGYLKKAYQLYLRTARLDLDNYNEDTDDGLHITSMAGTWLAIVKGFARMKVKNNQLNFSPFLPEAWDGYSFKILFRKRRLKITIKNDTILIELEDGQPLKLKIYEQEAEVIQGKVISIPLKDQRVCQ